MKKYSILTLALCMALPSLAQTLHEQLEVEGTYTPEVIVIDRISLLPQQQKFTLESTPLSYSIKSVPASYVPGYTTLPATAWGATRRLSDRPGYLNLAGGSWLNTNLSAGYRFLRDANSEVGAYLQFNSTSLFQPYEDIDVKRKRYDGTLGVYGSHIFSGIGRLDLSLAARLGYFNYYMAPYVREQETTAPTQTLTDMRFNADWSATNSGIDWKAGAAVRYFGYRSLYIPETEPTKGLRETNIALHGGAVVPWGDDSEILANARFDGYLYNSLADEGEKALDNYGNLSLLPAYRFNRGLLNIHIGAQVDLTFNAGPKGERFSFFHIAPDVRLDWRQGGVGLYLHALGGVTPQTLGSLSEWDYLQMPLLNATTPIYSPLDVTVGANFGPFSGFTAGLHLGYRISNNVQLRGLYPCLLTGYQPDPNLPATTEWLWNQGAINVKGFQGGIDLGYDYGQLLSFKASGTYQNQNGTKGYFNGYDRPRWIADASLSVKPWRTLRLGVDLQYRGCRHVYALQRSYPQQQMPSESLAALRLADLTLLNFAASYAITSDFSVYGRLNNLLNRHTFLLPLQSEGGINFLVGVDLRF